VIAGPDIYTGGREILELGQPVGILDRLRENKDEIHGTRVLVCAIDRRFDELLKQDSEIYERYYRATTADALPNIQALTGRLGQGFDIVHLVADVTDAGTIRDASGHEITGTEFIQCCCDHDVKLLWAAADNPPERYIKGFATRGNRLNLVMTLNRKGPNFASFLQNLLSRMACGDTMPIAWNGICPQIPHLNPKDVPESIFFAGRGDVKLLA
jgi:hypothetical protein